MGQEQNYILICCVCGALKSFNNIIVKYNRIDRYHDMIIDRGNKLLLVLTPQCLFLPIHGTFLWL